MNGRQRLALSLLASATIHALLLAGLAPALRFAPAALSPRQLPVVVSFSGKATPPLPAQDTPRFEPNGPSIVPPPDPEENAPGLDRAVRILVPPDFSEVEMLPTPIPIHLRFEFLVAGDGSITDLRLIRSSPVPSGLLPVIERALRTARFEPAVSGGRPIAGRFEMDVDVQPESPVEHLGGPRPKR